MDTPKNITFNISTAALVKILFVCLLLFGLFLIRDIVLMVLVSIVLASAMDPLVDWLYRKVKLPRGLSVISVYLVFVSILGLVGYFLIPAMVEQFGQLAVRLSDFRLELGDKTSGFSVFLDNLGLSHGLSGLGDAFQNFAGDFFQKTLGVVATLVRFVAVLAITFYLISSENGMKNLIKSIVPFKHHAYAVNLTDKIQSKIGKWLLGQLILSGFIFVLTYIGLSLLHVKYALALAILAGLFEIVPYLGPILSAVPAVLVAFIQSPPLAIFVVLLYIIIQEVENYVLVPKVMGKTVGANPVIILLAVLIGFKLAGIIGMLVAVPVVAAVTVFLADFRDSKAEGI